jgi:hypothetical protein
MANASDYKLLDRKVVLEWRRFTEHSTFFRGLSAWLGYKRTTFTFEVAERETGHTRWSFSKLIKLSIDAITSFSAIPLRLITVIGVVFMIGALILLIQTLIKLLYGSGRKRVYDRHRCRARNRSLHYDQPGTDRDIYRQNFRRGKEPPRYIVSEDTDRPLAKKLTLPSESSDRGV